MENVMIKIMIRVDDSGCGGNYVSDDVGRWKADDESHRTVSVMTDMGVMAISLNLVTRKIGSVLRNFLAISYVKSEHCNEDQLKNPMTSSENEPATFRLVA
jgi:hypothetical protein